jgi:hypothetical protein
MPLRLMGSGRFTSEERATGTHWIWGLDDIEKKNLNSEPSAVQPASSRSTDRTILASDVRVSQKKTFEQVKWFTGGSIPVGRPAILARVTVKDEISASETTEE